MQLVTGQPVPGQAARNNATLTVSGSSCLKGKWNQRHWNHGHWHGPAQLPEEPNRFIGRERELSYLRDTLHRTRALTLCGAGGIGKTRLALRLLATMAGDFADGVYAVELGDLWEPDLIVSRMAALIGVEAEAGHPLRDTLAGALETRQALIMLDSCEHLVDACAALCQRSAGQLPGAAHRGHQPGAAADPAGIRVAGRAARRPAPGRSPGRRRNWPASRRSSCSRTGRRRPGPASRSPSGTRWRWRPSAAPWTACRWPSSWPPPG